MTTPRPSWTTPTEGRMVFVIGAVQFVNILDFIMVMPLGPDFADALDIDPARLGIIGGAYTASAAVAGLLGGAWLDRLDRRTALLLSMVGLFVGTLTGALAAGFGSLVAARALAGAFGGPASAVALAILADVVPAERRGVAMGKVMGAFSVASVVGVPAGLELAHLGGWRAPFLVVATLGLGVAVAARLWLPSLRDHLRSDSRRPGLVTVLREPGIAAAAFMSGCGSLAGFTVIPNFPAYFQVNLGYPRAQFGLLYFVGGLFSFAVLRAGGRAVDRFGTLRVATFATLLLTADLLVGFIHRVEAIPVMVLFVTFMMGMSLRNVSMNTLSSKVPGPATRAGFLSVQSTSQHAFAATGAFLSTALLTSRDDGGLIGMENAAAFTLVVGLVLLVPMAVVERRVRARATEP